MTVATATEINRIVMQVDRRIEAAAAAEADRPGRVQIRLRTEIEIAHRDAAKARTIDRPRRADVSLPGNVAPVRTTGTRGRPGDKVAMDPGVRVEVDNTTRTANQMGTASGRCRRFARTWTGTADLRSNRIAKRPTAKGQRNSEPAMCQKTGYRWTWNRVSAYPGVTGRAWMRENPPPSGHNGRPRPNRPLLLRQINRVLPRLDRRR
jgi:hypothetical protein